MPKRESAMVFQLFSSHINLFAVNCLYLSCFIVLLWLYFDLSSTFKQVIYLKRILKKKILTLVNKKITLSPFFGYPYLGGCSEICKPPFGYGGHFGLMVIPIIYKCIIIRTIGKFQISAQSEIGKFINQFNLQGLITDKHRDR